MLVLHSRAGIIMDVIFSAELKGPLPPRCRTPPHVWEEIKTLLGAPNVKQAATAAIEIIAASLCLRACEKVRPSYLAEMAADKFTISDIRRAARPYIQFSLSAVTAAHGTKQLPEPKARITIKEGTCFIAVIDEAMKKASTRRGTGRVNSIRTRMALRDAQLGKASLAAVAEAAGVAVEVVADALPDHPSAYPTRAAMQRAAAAATVATHLPAAAAMTRATRKRTAAAEHDNGNHDEDYDAAAEAAPTRRQRVSPRHLPEIDAELEAEEEEDDACVNIVAAADKPAAVASDEEGRATTSSAPLANPTPALPVDGNDGGGSSDPVPAELTFLPPGVALKTFASAALETLEARMAPLAAMARKGTPYLGVRALKPSAVAKVAAGTEPSKYQQLDLAAPALSFLSHLTKAMGAAGRMMMLVGGKDAWLANQEFISSAGMVSLGMGESFSTIGLLMHRAGADSSSALRSSIAADLPSNTRLVSVFIDPRRISGVDRYGDSDAEPEYGPAEDPELPFEVELASGSGPPLPVEHGMVLVTRAPESTTAATYTVRERCRGGANMAPSRSVVELVFFVSRDVGTMCAAMSDLYVRLDMTESAHKMAP